MADKTQINPKLTPGMYATLVAYCKEKGRTQSDVVEAALEAWFTPSGTGTETQMIMDKLREQEAVLKRLVEVLTKVLAQQAAPLAPLPVAGPDVLYPGWQTPVAVPTVGEEAAPQADVTDPRAEDGLVTTGDDAPRWHWRPFGRRSR